MRRTYVILSAVSLVACSRGDDPAAAYRAYLEDLAAGDYAAAAGRLAPPTRAALESLRSAPPPSSVERIGPESTQDRVRGARDLAGALQLLVCGGDPDLPPPLTSKLVVDAAPRTTSTSADRATVEVTTPLGVRTATLVRESGVWKVLLAGL